MYDVIIVGGGPAGCAAAITLAGAGKSVCILEKGQPKREKTCGDGLMPDAQRMLKQLGVFDKVKESAKELTSAQFYPPRGNPINIPLSFLMITRAELDQILRDHAISKGVHIEYGMDVADIREDIQEVVIGKYRASHAIIATGANISLVKKIGITTSPIATAAAIRGYQKIKSKQHQISVFFIEDIMPGYAWIFPLNDTEANVGVGYAFDRAPAEKDLKKLLHKFVNSDRAKDILEGEPYNITAAPLRAGLRFKSSGTEKVLLCGETLDTTLHVIGEGVGKALTTGVMAAESIIEGNVQETYRKKLQTLQGIHEGYIALHNACDKPFVKTTLRSPYLTNIWRFVAQYLKGKEVHHADLQRREKRC
jgi:menaquinone-9 beta-reductase